MARERMRRDIHKEVEDALLDEQARVLIALPLPCHVVHLKRLPHEVDDHEDAHRCTMGDL